MFSEKRVSLYKTNRDNIKHFKSATVLQSHFFGGHDAVVIFDITNRF
jgi:hypothetical protein